MGILTRLIDSLAPEVVVEVREVRRPRKRPPSSAGNDYAKRFAIERRLSDRQIHELIGLCRGVLADGAVVEPEAKFLFEWLENNRACSGTWPHNFLYERIARILADGRITDEEEKELLDTIAKVAGVPTDEPASEPLESSGMSTAGLPYDDPAPRIEYDGRSFCVTGQFVYGPRSEVEILITKRGGKLVSAPSRKTHYLLVGSVGSHEWMHSTHGRKIEKAMQLRAEGVPIALVAEEHWVGFV